ncbi:beta-galactosidase [Streptomyces sp. CdTB01]|uniref:beta-galactosidase n=1 Tax=Streptomyces sp. CdTB01 TaxID=1725411 RepID=UPI00073A8B37|nr:beta-galactosidase [Streptomyces sp. CdTB01]ALV31236.1 hypothetical protein AS200_03585 [Streptomyces sp. CdTB01]
MSTTRRRALLACAVAAVLVTLAALAVLPRGAGSAQPRYFFGTLRTDPGKARLEHRNGIGVAHLTIRWEQFEPGPGRYDTRYIDHIRHDLQTLHKAGARVEAGVGINHPPQWLDRRFSDAAFTDEHGDRYTDTANVVFSQKIRDAVRRYIKALDSKVGLDNFWSIRVGVNDHGEFTYPPPVPTDGRPGSDYWAYDRYAQSASPSPGRARSVPLNPFPGWRPGERQYRGASFTRAQAARWYAWYLAALADAVNWQQDTYRSLGYGGLLKVLVPGAGYYPGDYAAAVREYFDGPRVGGLIGRGVGYFKTIEQIRPGKDVQIVTTSLVNGTGAPRANGCRPTDAAVRLDSSSDVRVRRWSSARWVTAIARREGFAVAGESAGPQVYPYYPGVMRDAARQVRTCGLKGLMWAFDGNLYDGTPGSSLQDYAEMIRHLT